MSGLRRVLSVLRVSVVNCFRDFYHHGGTENTEIGQGKSKTRLFGQTSGVDLFMIKKQKARRTNTVPKANSYQVDLLHDLT